MIVTVTQTIMSGTVVRWYRSVDAADAHGPPLVSVSRDGIRVNGYLHEVPDEVMEAATGAHAALSRDPRADMRLYATYCRSDVAGSLEPIERVT